MATMQGFIQLFIDVTEECGIRVQLANESYTSKACSICGGIHGNGRVHRELYVCPGTGKTITGINASPNIAGRNGYNINLMARR